MTSATARSREELWRLAAALHRRDDARRPARYRTLAANGREPPWRFADLRMAPSWLAWSEDRRNLLVARTGAIGVAQAWRATIDGRILRRAAEALGADVLERVLALPASSTPRLPRDPAESGDKLELKRLGGALLIADLADYPHLIGRIAPVLPGAPCPYPDIPQARLAVATAFALTDELEPLP